MKYTPETLPDELTIEVQAHHCGKIKHKRCETCPTAEALKEQYPLEDGYKWKVHISYIHVMRGDWSVHRFVNSAELRAAILLFDSPKSAASNAMFSLGVYRATINHLSRATNLVPPSA